MRQWNQVTGSRIRGSGLIESEPKNIEYRTAEYRRKELLSILFRARTHKICIGDKNWKYQDGIKIPENGYQN